MTTAYTSGTAYVNALATGTAGTGTTLTASGTGTVVEIDNMLRSMWDTSRISPTVIYVNSQELQNIKNKCLSNASAPLLHINQQIGDGKGFMMTAATLVFLFLAFGWMLLITALKVAQDEDWNRFLVVVVALVVAALAASIFLLALKVSARNRELEGSVY